MPACPDVEATREQGGMVARGRMDERRGAERVMLVRWRSGLGRLEMQRKESESSSHKKCAEITGKLQDEQGCTGMPL